MNSGTVRGFFFYFSFFLSLSHFYEYQWKIKSVQQYDDEKGMEWMRWSSFQEDH